MFNKKIRKKQQFSPTGFRYRGMESTRLENLTDAVFAFSITLLVIASEVPKTYVELKASMYGFVGFIACILLLLSIWNNHSVFFLKYGLQDSRTKTLNFLFLFVLLFYIYPLKYLFSYIGTVQFVNFLYYLGVDNEAFRIAISKLKVSGMDAGEWADLMIRFGIGLFSIHTLIAMMYWNALKQKKKLKLNKREIYETKSSIYTFIGLMLISITSITVVLIGGGVASGYAGMVYILVPVNVAFIRRYRRKRMDKKFPLESIKTKKQKKKKNNQDQQIKTNSVPTKKEVEKVTPKVVVKKTEDVEIEKGVPLNKSSNETEK